MERYNALILYFIEETERCLIDDSLILAESLNITKEKFEASCMSLIDQGFEREMFEIHASIHHKMKSIKFLFF